MVGVGCWGGCHFLVCVVFGSCVMDSIPWDSSPLNHHLGEYVLELFPSVFSSKSKFCRNTLDLVLKVDDTFSIFTSLCLQKGASKEARVYLKTIKNPKHNRERFGAIPRF